MVSSLEFDFQVSGSATVSFDSVCFASDSNSDVIDFAGVPMQVCSPCWFVPDIDKLIEEFKLRIQAYRKALFKRKVINNNKEHKPKIFRRMMLQYRTWRGAYSHV